MGRDMKWELPGFARRAINAVPDINAQPDQVQAFTGLCCSIVLHLILLVLWLCLQEGVIANILKALPKREVPIEIVIQTASILPERMSMPLDQLNERGRMDSAGLSEAKEAPKNQAFESDKNLEAGSKERPQGSAPLPQTSARERNADKSLVQRDAKAGSLEGRNTKVTPDVTRMSANSPSSKVNTLTKKKNPLAQENVESSRPEDIEDLGGELVFRKVSSGIAAPVKVSEKVGIGKKQKAVEDIPEEEAEKGNSRARLTAGWLKMGSRESTPQRHQWPCT